MWGDTYEQLTSIADIDESAEYVLGIDGTGFHYDGTTSWGKTALPSAQTPYKYTLKKANDGKSFTAQTTISSTTYYLQVPTSNTFSMAVATGTNTDLIIGTTQISGTNYAVANKGTTTRHLRINGTSGLRSYAGTTGSMAFFYKVIQDTPAYTITAQSNNNSYGTVSLSGSVITATPAAGYTYASPAYTVSSGTATVAQEENVFTVTPSSDCTVTINFETMPTYTVTFGDGGSVTQASYGAEVTLPSRSEKAGYVFAGWCETNVSSETTVAPTIIPAGSYTPTDNITLYPVYSKTVGGGGSQNKSANVTISDYASTNSWVNSTKYTSVTLDANATATVSNGGGNTGKYYSTNSSWRFYANESAKLTISIPSGELTSITITYTGNTLTYGGNNITSGTAISVSGTSAEFAVSGSSSNTQITAISVNYTITGTGTTFYWSAPVAATVEMPGIVIAENPFLFSTTATITCETEGAAIKYSYDGENWNDYSTALTITETKTIYAKAIKDENESTVASVTATKNLAEPTVAVSGDLTVDLNGETNVNAGTLTAAVTYNEAAVGGAVVTWSSSNTDVATIDENTGAVTIKARGNVTFTATFAANSDYATATGTKQITVTDSKAPGSAARPYKISEITATENGVYVQGIISYVTEVSTSYHNATYFISEDGTRTNEFEVFRGKYLDNADFTSEDQIAVGDEVVIYGDISTYKEKLQLGQNNYLTSIVHKTVKLNANGFATFASTSDLDFTDKDYTAWIVTAISGDVITFSKVTKAPANTGLLLMGTAGSTANITTTSGVAALSETNLLEAITVPTAVTADQYYGLSGNQFVKVYAGTVPAGKALLPASEITSSARELKFVFEGEATGIQNVNVNANLNKVYDLQGRRVAQPKQGLYIKGGKKYVVK